MLRNPLYTLLRNRCTLYSEILNYGFYIIQKGNKKGYYDNRTFEISIPIKYDDADFFYENLACVKLNDKYGFIDENGINKIPFIYEDAKSYSEGLACVKFKGKWGFIDKDGNQIISFKYFTAKNFDKGIAKIQKKPSLLEKIISIITLNFKNLKVKEFYIDKHGTEIFNLTNQKPLNNVETLSVDHILPFSSYALFINWWGSINLIFKIVLTERVLKKNYVFYSLPDLKDYEYISTCTNLDLEWMGNLLLNYNESIDNYCKGNYSKDSSLYANDNGFDLDTLKGIEAFLQIKYLNCSANNIIDFKPLSNLTNLIYLDLSDCGRKSKVFFDIEFDLNPLKNITKLEYLNLSGNNKVVNYEALFNLKDLKTLIIDECGLNFEEINMLKIKLPDCNIISTREYDNEEDEVEDDNDDYPF